MHERRELVWSNASFWTENASIHAEHDTIVSRNDPKMIAYYPSAGKRAAKVRTIIRPGRYLTKFFADVLTAKEIAYYADWQANGVPPKSDEPDGPIVHFATTPDEIEQVYLNGPPSCMSGKARDYDSPEHPVRIYGAGDLAIAYIRDADNPNIVVSRTICWPEKKVFGRLYPTGVYDKQEELKTALMARGFAPHQLAPHAFDGAKMLKIEGEDYDQYIMPYLDSPAEGFDVAGEYLILRTMNYTFAATETNGWNRGGSGVYAYHCERCGDRCDETYAVYTSVGTNGGSHDRDWCEYCEDNYSFRCEGFNDRFSSNDVASVEINGAKYTTYYAERHFTYSNFSNEWFDGEAVEVDGETWSREEFEENGFTCAIDGENYPNTDMHPSHPGIHKDADPDDIAAYIGNLLADRVISETIHDERQMPLPIAA